MRVAYIRYLPFVDMEDNMDGQSELAADEPYPAKREMPIDNATTRETCILIVASVLVVYQ